MTFRPQHLALLGLFLLAGCQPPQNNTRLTFGDLQETTSHMAQSLAASGFLKDRGPGSPPVVIVTNRVQNLTTDIIPEREQWMLMARVQDGLPIRSLGQQKNVIFQIPPERWKLIAGGGLAEPIGGPTLEPTHAMTAVFRSARRGARSLTDGGHVDALSDYYYLEYAITNLANRAIEWTDKFEIKRQSAGLRID